jgi:hypothetical protein
MRSILVRKISKRFDLCRTLNRSKQVASLARSLHADSNGPIATSHAIHWSNDKPVGKLRHQCGTQAAGLARTFAGSADQY